VNKDAVQIGDLRYIFSVEVNKKCFKYTIKSERKNFTYSSQKIAYCKLNFKMWLIYIYIYVSRKMTRMKFVK